MPRTIHVVTPSRATALLVVATIAAAGTWSLGLQSASATAGDPHKVWVCKYVQKPGAEEVLKRGKNPIHVDAASLTNDRGVAPALGDTFSDGQFRSVVVSLDAAAPTTACPTTVTESAAGPVARPRTTVSATPTPPATTAATAAATSAAATPTAPVTSSVVPSGSAITTVAQPVATEAVVAGVGGVEAPATVALAAVPALGDGAPDTGGMGQVADRTSTLDVIVGLGLFVLAGVLFTVRTRRRGRSTAEVD